MDLAALSHGDRVTFTLGQIVEAAVTLDAAARFTLTTLQRTPFAPIHDVGRQLTTILTECERALASRTELPDDVISDGAAALLQAKDAYNERHRYVHDQLRHVGADAWNRVRLDRAKGAALPEEREVSFEDIRQAHLDLARAEWRIHALRITVALCDGFEIPGVEPAWRVILAGGFDVDDNGWAFVDEAED